MANLFGTQNMEELSVLATFYYSYLLHIIIYLLYMNNYYLLGKEIW